MVCISLHPTLIHCIPLHSCWINADNVTTVMGRLCHLSQLSFTFSFDFTSLRFKLISSHLTSIRFVHFQFVCFFPLVCLQSVRGWSYVGMPIGTVLTEPTILAAGILFLHWLGMWWHPHSYPALLPITTTSQLSVLTLEPITFI